MKKIKITTKELGDALERTSKITGVDPEKIKSEATDGLGYFLSDNPQLFECKRCHNDYQPKKRQWIFHKLCDNCFMLFDEQKMKGRFALLLQKKQTAYFEDSDAWVQAFPFHTL